MFIGVDEKDLVSGTKYAMWVGVLEPRYFTATFIDDGLGRQLFYYRKEHSGIQHINTYNILRAMQNKKRIDFFAFVPQKEKIVQAMEQRALDKILKRLINDDFTW